jgi:hypothetical protein
MLRVREYRSDKILTDIICYLLGSAAFKKENSFSLIVWGAKTP